MGTGMPMRRDFDKVDAQHRGYSTSEDVKSDEWVHNNFTKCNVKHDGHMSRDQYNNCHESLGGRLAILDRQ